MQPHGAPVLGQIWAQKDSEETSKNFMVQFSSAALLALFLLA
jgi:hypothetical protein